MDRPAEKFAQIKTAVDRKELTRRSKELPHHLSCCRGRGILLRDADQEVL